jgi:hypothetical protein
MARNAIEHVARDKRTKLSHKLRAAVLFPAILNRPRVLEPDRHRNNNVGHRWRNNLKKGVLQRGPENRKRTVLEERKDTLDNQIPNNRTLDPQTNGDAVRSNNQRRSSRKRNQDAIPDPDQMIPKRMHEQNPLINMLVVVPFE